MAPYGVAIKGVGVSLPETIVYNEALTQLVDTSDEWIHSRTGFKARHVVKGNEMMTDLAIQSSREALAFAGIEADEVDLIIMASSTPDYIYPAGCATVQHAIGATHAFGFDMAMGCSGLMYAMATAIQFIENGAAKTALVIGSDTHSRYTDWYDRNTCVLFGDGAGAFILQRHETPGKTDILGIDLMLDGGKGPEIKLPVNRDNCPLVEPRSDLEKSAIYMNGREVFKFAVTEVPKRIEAALTQANLTPYDIDYYVLHQANERIMIAMAEHMNLDPEKLVVHLAEYGNTSAATIPLALNDAIKSGQIKPGHKLVLCGFGAGLAVATLVVNWTCVDQRISASQQSAQPIEAV